MEKLKALLCRKLGRHTLSIATAIVAVSYLGGCASSSGVAEFVANDCKQISKRAEAKINWARVPEVEIRVRNGEFSPMVTRLQQGGPTYCGSATATTARGCSAPVISSRITR